MNRKIHIFHSGYEPGTKKTSGICESKTQSTNFYFFIHIQSSRQYYMSEIIYYFISKAPELLRTPDISKFDITYLNKDRALHMLYGEFREPCGCRVRRGILHRWSLYRGFRETFCRGDSYQRCRVQQL